MKDRHKNVGQIIDCVKTFPPHKTLETYSTNNQAQFGNLIELYENQNQPLLVAIPQIQLLLPT